MDAKNTYLDDETDLQPLVHRIILAADAPPLECPGPRSVFDLGERPVKWRRINQQDERPPTGRRIERANGVTRLINFPISETAEWRAREAARRARQKPPRSGQQKLKTAMAGWGLFAGEVMAGVPA